MFSVAVLAALGMFISPCVLPLLPVYVAYFSGGKSGRLKTLLNALAFCLGISVVFIALFAAFTAIAMQINIYINEIYAVCGILLVMFGLKTMGYLDLPFLNKSFNINAKTEGLNPLNALILGFIFSLSMGACGLGYLSSLLPIIAEANLAEGLLVGGIFTLTLSVLFVVCAMLVDQLKGLFRFIKKNYEVINRASGALLFLFGFFIAMGFMQKVNTWASPEEFVKIIITIVIMIVAFSLMMSTTAYRFGVESGKRKTSVILLIVGVTGLTLLPGVFHLLGTVKHRKELQASQSAEDDGSAENTADDADSGTDAGENTASAE